MKKEYVANYDKLRKLEDQYYSTINKLNVYAQISASMHLAKAYAGVYNSSLLKRPTRSRHTYLLKLTARKSQKLNKIQKEVVANNLLLIWTRNTEGKTNYLKIPFDYNVFNRTRFTNPINERRAIQYYKIANRKKATREYYRIAGKNITEDQRFGILERIVKWDAAEYTKTGKYKTLESQFSRQIPITAKVESDRSSKHMLFLITSYKSLVDTETSKTLLDKKPNKKKAYSTIGLIDRYMAKSLPDAKQKGDLYNNAGKIYHKIGQYRKSTSRHLKASDSYETTTDQVTAISQAIKSQSKLANWPYSNVPWTQKFASKKRELVVLQKLYARKNGLQKEINWTDKSHEGLILVKLGKKVDAADIWSSALLINSSGKNAEYASYLAMQTYSLDKNWSKLENLSRNLEQSRINPTFMGKTIKSSDMLALALFEGGKSKYSEKQFDVASTKFQEYITRFNKPNKHDAKFYLTKSLWNNSDHREAVEQAVDFTRREIKSKHWETVAVLGFDWSRSMALESTTLFFLEEYVKRFNNDRAYAMRWQGVKIYVGLERYVQAMEHITKLSSMAQTTDKIKVQLIDSQLTIAYKYGSLDTAAKIADALLSQPATSNLKAKAILIKAKYLNENENLSELVKLENTLRSLKPRTDEIVNSHAEIALMIADAKVDPDTFEKVHNSSLADPIAYLNQLEKQASDLYKDFRNVCDLGNTSTCPEAMNKFETLAIQILENVDDVEIADTLEEKSVNDFSSTKEKVQTDIKQMINTSFSLAYSQTSKGNALPETTQTTLWRKGMDWNFEPISKTPGNGFVDWHLKGSKTSI